MHLAYAKDAKESVKMLLFSVNHVTSVFISRQDGERLAELADNSLLSNVTIAVKHVLSYRVVANTGAVTPASLIAVITMVTLVLLLVAIFLGRAIWKKYRAKTSKHKKATAVGACEQRQVHCEQR